MDIKEVVETLIKIHGTSCPFELAKIKDIGILYENLGSKLGYFSKDYRFKFIHINQALKSRRQRFVCAHELGHAIMHPDVNTPFLSRYTLFSVSKVERQANTFAVELLMPDDLLQKHSEISLYNIAKELGIPGKLADLKEIKK